MKKGDFFPLFSKGLSKKIEVVEDFLSQGVIETLCGHVERNESESCSEGNGEKDKPRKACFQMA